MRGTGKILAAAAALTLLGGAALGLAARRAPPPAPRPPAPGEPGWQTRRSLALEARIRRPGRGPSGLVLQGEWATTVDAVREGEIDVACRVAGARLSGVDRSAPPGEVEALRARLERTFWVTTRRDGAVIRVHFPREVAPADRNLLQMIATEAQLVAPAGAPAAWTALERDGAGTYLAAYHRESPDRLAKRKLHYLDADGTSGGGPGGIVVELVADERHFTLDARGSPSALEVQSRVRVGALGAGDRLDLEILLRLADAREGAAPELAGSLARARGVESSPVQTQRTSPEEAQAQRDRSLLEGRTAVALLAEAARNPTDPALLEQLAALFRLHPEAIPAAARLWRGERGPRLVADALGTAGTPAAVGALNGVLLDATAANQARIEAAAALARVRRPTTEAMRLPLALLDDPRPALRRAAQLGVGSLARTGREEHPDAAGEVERELASRYEASRDPEERVALLAALGNAAGPAATEVLSRALGDSRPGVRAAAARGLRLASGPDVDALLATAMASDGDAGVRLAAIFAAGFRPADAFVETLCAAAIGDPAEQVRSGAVGLLRRHLDDSPSIRRALAQVAARDASPGIRRLAREAVAARVR